MTNFYNSGLYMQPFFTKHKECHIMSNEDIFDEIDYNLELFAKYHKGNFKWKYEDELRDQVFDLLVEHLSCYHTYFEPIIFKEEIAFECGLTPFKTDKFNLLALVASGMDFSPRLDSYQALTDNSIDEASYLFKDLEYFKSIVGKGLTQKVLDAISFF